MLEYGDIRVVVNIEVGSFVFLFKQKTAYEMRISDWSSDVCSSDLATTSAPPLGRSRRALLHREDSRAAADLLLRSPARGAAAAALAPEPRPLAPVVPVAGGLREPPPLLRHRPHTAPAALSPGRPTAARRPCARHRRSRPRPPP